MRVSFGADPPVKVIVVVLGLRPEVKEKQREAEGRRQHSEAGAFRLPGREAGSSH